MDLEREVGRGIRMGNTCKPMAVSFKCMTKFTTNKKNLKKIKEMDLITVVRGYFNVIVTFLQRSKIIFF